jgi:hypothetical protein
MELSHQFHVRAALLSRKEPQIRSGMGFKAGMDAAEKSVIRAPPRRGLSIIQFLGQSLN